MVPPHFVALSLCLLCALLEGASAQPGRYHSPCVPGPPGPPGPPGLETPPRTMPEFCYDVITSYGACVIDDMILYRETCIGAMGQEFYTRMLETQARFEQMRRIGVVS